MKFQTKTIISSGDVAVNQVSEVIDFKYNYGFAIQCSFTGAPTGSVEIEGSNDGINWSIIESLAISDLTVLSSNKDAIYWPQVRVRKAASGTGTITASITIKGA